jgi:type I restriction enzyme, S subunit
MNTPFMRRQADAAARGVAQKTVNLGDIKKFLAIIPPIPVQEAFVERVAEIQATMAQQERMAEASDQLVAALTAQLFDVAASKPDALAAAPA